MNARSPEDKQHRSRGIADISGHSIVGRVTIEPLIDGGAGENERRRRKDLTSRRRNGADSHRQHCVREHVDEKRVIQKRG